MHILKRASGDDFTLRLFVKLTSQYKDNADIFYLWSPCFDPSHSKITHNIGPVIFYENEVIYRNALMSNIKNDLVIIGIKDHLTSANFNPWTDSKPDLIEYLYGMFDYYPNKKFIIFTSLENLEHYISSQRIQIVPWGGDLTNHKIEYEKLEPLKEKNLKSPYTFLSLNRSARHHRTVLVSLLYGLNIENHGLISCMFKNSVHSIPSRHLGWEFNENQIDIKNTIDAGFRKLKTSELKLNENREDSGCYPQSANTDNFKQHLINYYKETFVEIITETSCTEKCFNLTEKTLNSIYGKSFPILISSPGVVSFLRRMGMDVFDDIIDHSYDTVENPVDRIYQAISSNIELLTNNKRAKDLWARNQDRFVKNIDFAKIDLYNFYKNRTIEKFNESIKNI